MIAVKRSCGTFIWVGCLLLAHAGGDPMSLEISFEKYVKPLFLETCVKCHNTDLATAGIRIDHLNSRLEDGQIPVWEAVRKRISEGTMPPKGLPQPPSAERRRIVDWTNGALEVARLRPVPKNGLIRRLTISQYR